MSDDLPRWPVAIIEDRYNGTYSGGMWLAISEADQMFGGHMRVSWCLEEGPHGDDGDAMMFWRDPPPWIAVGHSPEEARRALRCNPTGEEP